MGLDDLAARMGGRADGVVHPAYLSEGHGRLLPGGGRGRGDVPSSMEVCIPWWKQVLERRDAFLGPGQPAERQSQAGHVRSVGCLRTVAAAGWKRNGEQRKRALGSIEPRGSFPGTDVDHTAARPQGSVADPERRGLPKAPPDLLPYRDEGGTPRDGRAQAMDVEGHGFRLASIPREGAQENTSLEDWGDREMHAQRAL